MADITAIPGIADLRRHARGDPCVCVAVLDGPVDRDHPCFAGANLTPLATLASGRATGGGMSRHGTHVASVIFGRHDGPVPGLAPGCRGLIVPIFSDEEGHLSQLDLARAIDQAVEAGALEQRQRRAEGPYQRGGGSPGPGDPARPGSERADRRRGRERRLRLPARPRRGGVTAVGCLGLLLTFRRTDHDHDHEDAASPPRSPCRGRRRRGRPRPPRSGVNVAVPAGGDEPRGNGGWGGITPSGSLCDPDDPLCRGQQVVLVQPPVI